MSVKEASRRTFDADAPKPASRIRAKQEWQLLWEDRRTQTSIGLMLMFGAIYLLAACISHLFTGNADQSFLLGTPDPNQDKADIIVENWFGYLGAWASHYLVYGGFGLGTFLLLPIPFFVGIKMLMNWEELILKPTLQFLLFWAFWLCFAAGYVCVAGHLESKYTFLAGSVGYESARVISELIGWGTPLLILTTALFHLVWYFGYVEFSDLWNKDARLARLGKAPQEIIVEPGEAKVRRRRSKLAEDDEDESLLASDNQAFSLEDEEDGELVPVIQPSDLKFEVSHGVPDEELPAEEFYQQPSTSPQQPSSTSETSSIKTPTAGKLEFEVVRPPLPDPEGQLPLEFESITHVEQEAVAKTVENYDPTLDLSTYQHPIVQLLTEAPPHNVEVDDAELSENKDKILQTLSDFGIGISSIKATIGPTVTLYEIVPNAGIRVNKIKNLEEDIALSLAALGIRIIAPMPGKGTIGIEVPNKRRETVFLRSVLSTEKFMRSNMDLPVVLGKTISNEVLVADLAKMPHLLMAGATGQGKSVGINILLTSLLYKKHPSQLKLVLVDPKKVELSVYSAIEKHFLAKLPGDDDAIITDTRKVIHTLNSLCVEMDTRYDLLKEAGCRNLKEYNQKFIERRLNPTHGHRFMPYIVLIIDELADLMMTAGKEVESPIARLAQLARAIGIHLVVATQRPSVNVITGIIKANFPARLSFRVTSKIDSRTILDAGGAEQLVGMGDMLLSQGSDIVRIQCPFVDTPEVERICEFIGQQRGYQSAWELPIPESMEAEESENNDYDLDDLDSSFAACARLVVTEQSGSTSLLQRKLKIGYNRAGRIMDQLAAKGIVGPGKGSKPREVYIQDLYQLEDMLRDMGLS